MKHQLQALIPFDVVFKYPFSWFDELLETKTNPLSIYFRLPGSNDLLKWKDEVDIQINNIYRILREQTFSLHSASEIRPVVEQYLETIDFYRAQEKSNHALLEHQPELSEFLSGVSEALIDLTTRIVRRFDKYLPETRNTQRTSGTILSRAKLTCTLSADQIGIILKAADDTKLVLARSISSVFQTIIPHLSTTNRTELSWKSVRSNSYRAEETDKDLAIASLEALIRTIRTY